MDKTFISEREEKVSLVRGNLIVKNVLGGTISEPHTYSTSQINPLSSVAFCPAIFKFYRNAYELFVSTSIYDLT